MAIVKLNCGTNSQVSTAKNDFLFNPIVVLAKTVTYIVSGHCKLFLIHYSIERIFIQFPFNYQINYKLGQIYDLPLSFNT